ncbi:MAG: membrane dipeptidase, partial [Deltaproteobacteria bacterium]|nr:membrane dipeptidase [Deltaproteobacteria bacterium]
MRGPKIPVSPEARALHAAALVVDLHSHYLIGGTFLGRDFYTRHPAPRLFHPMPTTVSHPALLEGGVSVSAFTTYVPGAPFFPGSARARTHRIIDRFEEVVRQGAGRLRPVTTAADMRRAKADGVLGGFLGVEGAHVLEGEPDELDRLHARGVRMLTLTHFVSNGVADGTSSPWRPLGGLSDFGREVVRRMDRLGMLICTAHCTDRAFDQVLETASGPVICSHGALRSFEGIERNHTEDQVRRLAGTGGLMGVMFFPRYLGRRAGTDARAVAVHAARIAEVAGAGAVGLGSDMDSPIWLPRGFDDAGDWPQLTQALLDVGFGRDEVLGILGGNALQVFEVV